MDKLKINAINWKSINKVDCPEGKAWCWRCKKCKIVADFILDSGKISDMCSDCGAVIKG